MLIVGKKDEAKRLFNLIPKKYKTWVRFYVDDWKWKRKIRLRKIKERE